MTTPVVNYIPTFYLSTGLPASGYYLKAYEAGAVSTAVTTYTSAADVTGGTKFQLNSLGQPASGGTAFAPHYGESVDAWIFPTSAEADANDTSNAIQVIDASVVNPFAVLNDTVQKVGSAVGSAADAITANLTVTPTLTDPLMVRVELSHGANTVTNPTFNLNSLGAKTIKRGANTALQVGDTGGSGAVLDLAWSETNDVWILLNPATATQFGSAVVAASNLADQAVTASKLAYGDLSVKTGLVATINSSNPTTDLDISAGEIIDSTQSYMLQMATARLKRIDATYAVATDATRTGGFSNQSSRATNTWYQVFLLGKSTDETVTDIIIASTQANALADTVAAAAGFDLARRIGYARTNGTGSGEWHLHLKDGQNRFLWDVMSQDETTVSATVDPVTVRVPPNQTGEFVYSLYSTDANLKYGLLTQIGQTNTAPSATVFDVATSDNTTHDRAQAVIRMKVDGSSQINHRESTATALTVVINTRGWIDDLSVWS